MAGKWSLKRAFLRTLMVAIGAGAAFGIYALLFGDFGETEFKILLTTLCIIYFSITSLSCAAAFERKKGSVLAPAGLGVGMLGLVVFIPVIWAEGWNSKAVGDAMGILAIFAFSLAQACLLALVPLERSVRWVFFATVATVFALAILLSGMIVFEAEDGYGFFRIAGVLGILDGCGSLFVPLLYKLGGKRPLETGAGRGLDSIELCCPRCGQRGKYPLGTIQCERCSLGIKVAIG